MTTEIKLIYLGILNFGFKNNQGISIIGLIDFIIKNKLKLEEEPCFSLNRSYIKNPDEWFWELEWNNDLISGKRCLIVYFDDCGCHFQRFYSLEEIIEGDIKVYEDFLIHFEWLSGKNS